MGATWEKVGAYGMGTSPSQPSGIWSAQRSTGLRRSASFLGLGNPDQKSKPFSSLGERFLLGLKLKKSPGINSPFPKDPSLAFLSELRPKRFATLCPQFPFLPAGPRYLGKMFSLNLYPAKKPSKTVVGLVRPVLWRCHRTRPSWAASRSTYTRGLRFYQMEVGKLRGMVHEWDVPNPRGDPKHPVVVKRICEQEDCIR